MPDRTPSIFWDKPARASASLRRRGIGFSAFSSDAKPCPPVNFGNSFEFALKSRYLDFLSGSCAPEVFTPSNNANLHEIQYYLEFLSHLLPSILTMPALPVSAGLSI